MNKAKKYDYRVVPFEGGWCVEIIRRASRQKMIISKKQDGFSTETEAQEWGEKALKEFSEKLNESNKRQAEKRK